MAFPVTKRYFLDFRNSDTGLTPTFVFLQVTPGFGATSPASPAGGIIEKSNGRYYFDWIWLTTADSDIVFEVDGGVSIPTEEVRYIKGTISPRDAFLDEPISQIKDDVWNDVVNRTVGTKGEYVETIGLPADNSAQATLFGKTLLYKESIKGADDRSLTNVAGAGWVATDNLNTIKTAVDAINIETDAASIANAVWDAATAGNITGGTMGGLVNTAASVPSAATVAAAVWDEVITAHVIDGTYGQTLQLLNYGTAVAGAASTLTLAAGASALNSFYNNSLVVITSGTGSGQARTITAYVGGTKVATVDRVWGTTPNGSSKYMIVPAAQAPLDTTSIVNAVWNESMASHLAVGSTGEKLNAGGTGGGVSFLANGDTVNPIIVQVSSPKHTQVKITYSEPVVMTGAANGALNLANYTIPGLTLLGVTSITAQQVLITTSAQTPSFLYTLVVANVEDLVGNPIL